MDTPLLGESRADDGGAGDGDGDDGGPSWLNEENDAIYSASASGEDGGGADGAGTDDGGAGRAARSNAAWAADDEGAGAGRGAASGGSGAAAGGGDSGGGSWGDLPKIVLGAKIVNIGAAVLLMAASISLMVDTPSTIAEWVLAAYAALFGLLLLFPEVPLSALRSAAAHSFGFLYSPLLRLLFLGLASSVAWSYQTPVGDAACAALAASAVLGSYALCCHPSVSAERDRAAEEEEQRAEAVEREEERRRAREIAKRWRGGSNCL